MYIYVSYSNRKILNIEKDNRIKILLLLDIIVSILYACICKLLETEINTTIFILICISIIYAIVYKFKITYSILISAISISLNQIIWFVAAAISYIFIRILNINNKYINLFMNAIIQFILLILFWQIKRIRNGITF